MHMIDRIFTAAALISVSLANAQYTPPDPAGFEGIIVESYYVADANDAADTDGGANLADGARTYRVFADLLDGYRLQTVGGFENHPLTFNTTTTFFYNEDRGEAWGTDIPSNRLDQNTVAIDSWLTIGAASDAHWGVLRFEDPDGSIIGGVNNDGGSEGVTGGLLVSTASEGPALTVSDGLYTAAEPVPATPSALGETPTIFNEANGATYSSQDFACGVLNDFGGVSSPLPGNKVLLGQFTTDGEFSFCLNLYVKIPTELVCPSLDCHLELVFYADLLEADTAGAGVSGDNKFTHPSLCFNSATAVFDCQGIASGSALVGTPCDDGNPETTNDVWNAACDCVGGGGTGIDEAASLAALIGVEPNPTTDLLRLSLYELDGEKVSFDLVDATGRSVLFRELGSLSGQWKGTLDLGAFEHGMYLLRFQVGDRFHTERIIKQ